MRVVSGYTSGRDGRALVNNDSIFSPLWRVSFGLPTPRATAHESFVATRVNVKIIMSFREAHDRDLGEDAYQTLIFGAVVNSDHPNQAASAKLEGQQLASIRAVIAADYSSFGFDNDRIPHGAAE